MKPAGFVALVLSAGKGERLGGICKGLLQIGQEPLVSRQARFALQAGARHVLVVTGFMGQDIQTALSPLQGVSTLPAYLEPAEQLCSHARAVEITASQTEPSVQESARKGLEAARSRYPGLDVALSLVDLPLITADHFSRVHRYLDAQAPSMADAVIPQNPQGQPGHPILLRGSWLKVLPLNEPGFHLKSALNNRQANVAFYETQDPAHFTDLDTPQDMVNLRARYGIEIQRPFSAG